MNNHWIPIDRIEPLIGAESMALVISLSLTAYVCYRLFLRGTSLKRHTNMRRRFKVLAVYVGISAGLSLVEWLLGLIEPAQTPAFGPIPAISWPRLASYVALLSMIAGAISIVRLAQAYVYLVLFIANMRTGVPRLIANVFTLLFAIIVAGWVLSQVFGVELAPLLATSAIFSVVLGLALQDTLGNFFSGIALQLDRSFNIGDWVEIQNGNQKWVGQVMEITWRATALAAPAGELISIPNRTLAQSQVILYSQLGLPPRRNQAFRFPLETPIARAREALLEGMREVGGILPDPAPGVLVMETTDSWITMKSFYSIEDFGEQYGIADQVITKTLEAIRRAGLTLASPTLALVSRSTDESSLAEAIHIVAAPDKQADL